MGRILIVDDDADLVHILTKALENQGHELASSGDPRGGLERARQFKPDLIILDYHMPGETGAHLFESFRRNGSTARTPILFMSGEATQDQIIAETADFANTRFLPKPAHIADLQRVIREMLALASPQS
ncbi:MAG: response regulator [Elusimicrobia bacterium]|nr:response regulator [Elusimicrobiota bacterium]